MTPEEYRKWLEEHISKNEKLAKDNADNRDKFLFHSTGKVAFEKALNEFKEVEQYINRLEEELKSRDDSIMAELDYEKEQSEAQAAYEAEIEAEDQAQAEQYSYGDDY